MNFLTPYRVDRQQKSVVRLQTILLSVALLWPGHDSLAQTENSLVTIRPFRTGVCSIGEDHLFGADFSAADRVPFTIYSFLIEGAKGEKALVDLGPKTLVYCNAMFLRYGFFRDLGPDAPPGKRYPDNITQPEGNIFDQLRAIDIKSSEIGHIVFSHLHADHHGMDNGRNGGAAADFPNAILHVSKIGWQDNLDKRKGTKWNSYVDYAFSDFLMDSANRKKVRFEDNVRIFPGVRTLYLGGHSVCSQAVLLDTAEGLVILASDDIYLYRLLEEGVMPQIRTSKEKYREAVQRMVNLAVQKKGIIVPMHDPIVWDAYCKEGTHWLRALREYSDRAVRAYLKRAPEATR